MTAEPLKHPSDILYVLEELAKTSVVNVRHASPVGGGVVHTIDFSDGVRAFTIAWHPEHGYSLTSLDGETVLGEGHDEVFAHVGDLLARVREVLRGDDVRHSIGVWLGDVRRFARITQAVLGATLGRSQSAVAQLEGRDDLYVSTLIEFARAIGAELQIRLRIRDSEFSYPGHLRRVCTPESLSVVSSETLISGSVQLPVIELSEAPSLNDALGAAEPKRARSTRRFADSNPGLLEACA